MIHVENEGKDGDVNLREGYILSLVRNSAVCRSSFIQGSSSKCHSPYDLGTVSHSRIVPSSLPVAYISPSGEYDAEWTGPWCACEPARKRISAAWSSGCLFRAANA